MGCAPSQEAGLVFPQQLTASSQGSVYSLSEASVMFFIYILVNIYFRVLLKDLNTYKYGKSLYTQRLYEFLVHFIVSQSLNA